ncbi:MAG: acetylglutamate kinase [Rhodospirillaceae bacterium]|jgi:acetylglutamate kinase|nr:acetylglutamate kinase [Rhodospirillaceae bacterium]MBT3628272.1 acetylglutamate kinase [Rhodospirillaceae bacterium]MBT3928751.1 acetylglutamate kinase [Rhodospirillaceae bacterium]MBT4427402.1 acetylglutamate kinase [Rhodospirillaceae bacterium]MBT5038629.1 acetylglutamate kinase [Rhodospirillaceae bacterium]
MTTKNISETKHWLRAAQTISEALPYMRRFSGRTFVIKYGGHAMGDAGLAEKFANDVVLLKQVGINPVVVHGGGPQIAKMLERLSIESSFVDGLRVTDEAAIEVVEMVLSGTINKEIVSTINAAGGTAVGLSGKDGKLLEARRLTEPGSEGDLGFVGEPSKVNISVLQSFEKSHIIPVVAPIGAGPDGETFNINADTAAGAIASAMSAAKLIMLTDVAGVLDADGELISSLNVAQTRELLEGGAVKGGMIPKLKTCLQALQNETDAAHILDGRIPHSLLLEIFTAHGTGTMIVPGD